MNLIAEAVAKSNKYHMSGSNEGLAAAIMSVGESGTLITLVVISFPYS